MEKGDNGLLDVIIDICSFRFLSYNRLMAKYFQEKNADHLIKDITLKEMNDDIVIEVQYFAYKKNNWFEEWSDLFYINEKEFIATKLCGIVLEKKKDIDTNKKNIDEKIEKIKREIALNEIVKKTTEELIVNYLNNEQVSTDENKSNISFEQFDKYIKENSEHIKKFFEKNWPCARYLHTTYALNDLISSFCQIYLLYKAVVAPGEQATVKMAIAVVIYFIVSSSTIEIVEEISINKKLSEIRQFGFEKEIKAKVKKLVTKNHDE